MMDVKFRAFLAEEDARAGELTYRDHIFLADVDFRPDKSIDRWEMRVRRQIGATNTQTLIQTCHVTPDDAIKAAEQYVRNVVDEDQRSQ
jgi:hypothetical protein